MGSGRAGVGALSSSASLRAWRPGPSSTSCSRPRCSSSASVLIAPRGQLARVRCVGLAALAGGGYWYLRNLAHTGNPLPWVHHLGPIDLPAPEQALGGREAHSVLGYLTDGSVWSDWFLPGLHHGLWIVWPLLCLAAVAGLILCPRLWPVPRGALRKTTKRPGAGQRQPPRSRLRLLCAGVAARRAGRCGRLARRADLRLRPRRHAPRLRVRPPLPRPGAGPRPIPAPGRSAARPRGPSPLSPHPGCPL